MTKDTRKETNYSQQMTHLRDLIAPIAADLGIPTARNLIIRLQAREEGKLQWQIFKIEPTPIIERSRPRDGVAFESGLRTKDDDFMVYGISRKYDRELIIGTGVSYFVDGEIIGGELVGGIECELSSVEELPLTWNLTLTRKPDERRGI